MSEELLLSCTADDSKSVYRSRPINQIRNGSVSNSRTSSNSNLAEQSSDSEALANQLFRKMADQSFNGMSKNQGDSGNFSLGGSSEILYSPSTSNTNEANFKSKLVNSIIVWCLFPKLLNSLILQYLIK